MSRTTCLGLSLLVVAFRIASGTIGFGAAPATNPAPVQYTSSGGGGEAAVSGTSTLHDWTVKGNAIQGTAAFSAVWKAGGNPAMAVQSIDLTIPVSSLKSTEGSGMDNTMYDALKLKQYPNIAYKLSKATLKAALSDVARPSHFDSIGQITIAGTTHDENLDLSILRVNETQLTITTEIRMKMSDFGIKPPTAMLGMIKAGDAITVKVSWQLGVTPAVMKAEK